MQIFVKTLSGKSIALEVESTDDSTDQAEAEPGVKENQSELGTESSVK